jgi:hypothetical protein
MQAAISSSKPVSSSVNAPTCMANEPNETHPAKISASRPASTTGLSSRRQALEAQSVNKRLTPADIQLAAYVLARHLDPGSANVSKHELAMLKTANAVVEQTRQVMHHRGGNVDQDIQATNHRCSRVTQAVRDLYNAESHEPWSRSEVFGVSAYAGDGNCGEQAGIAQHLLAQTRLQEGGLEASEQIDVHCNPLLNKHCWAVWRRSYEAQETHEIVLDPWAFGPAVNAKDARGMPNPVGSNRHEITLTPTNAAQAVTEFNQGKNSIGPQQQDAIDQRIKQLTREEFSFEALQRTSVLQKRVTQSTKQRLQRAMDSSSAHQETAKQTHHPLELNAASAAFALGASQDEAFACAAKIIQTAQNF